MKYTIVFVVALLVGGSSCKSSKETISETTTVEKRRSNGERPNMDQMFTQMDADKDGRLSKSEVKGRMAENFSKIDLDSDGFITKEEMEKAPKPARGQRGPRRG